jgi:hypothetical protein
MDGHSPSFHGRSELAMADAVIVWGANLPANARALWRTIAAARDRRGDTLEVFVVDPGLPDLPDVPAFARRISIAPGSDRHLALALMLRMVGNPGHALPLRQVPPDPRFDDAARGLTRFLSTQGANLADFVSHVRGVAATYLQVVAGVVTPDAALADLCLLPGATADDRARFTTDVRALFEACLGGAAAFVLGSGPSRFVDGEEHVQYLAALAFLSGNVGAAGAGLSFGEDRHPTFNTAAFAAAHDTRRPGENPELGAVADQETLNAASLAADAPDTTKVLLWFDLDPLTHLPDPAAMESLLQRSQLNVQISHGLDDASRFADVLLPLGDSLRSFDLQVGTRSPWINLTQPLLPREDPGPRPMARILHELLEAVRAQLVEDDFDDDLEPVFEEAVYRTGALLLPRARRAFFAAFFEDAPRIPNLLTDRLPVDEAANIRAHLKDWYASVRGGEPATDTDDGVTFNNAPRFFDRMQVDWMLEALFARHTEREVVLLLYNLLQRGTVLDPRRFGGDSFGVLPDGGTPLARFVVNGTRHADLKGAAGFAPERAAYRDAVAAVEAGATGRAAFPMRLVIAQSPSFASTHIPLAEQVAGGAVLPPVAVLNPASPSVRAFPGGLAAGAAVALVGNVTYRPGETFETVIARATVQFDPTMALETIRMTPGWHGLDRGGQRLARGVHSEEGEVPALFDNLVRLAPAGYVPAGNAAGRGASPPKR